MNDLISRQAALDALDWKWAGKAAIDAIKNLPPVLTIDPVKHGTWIWDDEGYHCSECFYHAYGNTGEVYMGDWHYCPHCGAKMDGGEG